MIPKSFSATALEVADLCMARYQAQYIDGGVGFKGTAASLGTAVHSALEAYVKSVYITCEYKADKKLLLDLFRMSYMSTFDTADTDTEEYRDGIEMLEKWYERTTEYLETRATVLSCEIKENFLIPTSAGEFPYNYIFDRSDDLGDGEYKVVDYKTQRWAIRTEDLRKKIQVRAYGLAMQIQYPQAREIWVELDFLRHDGPVGVKLTREDNITAWKFFKTRAQQIIDTDPEDVAETLNPQCRFCIRKQTCDALKRNIAVGGIFSVGSAAEMIDLRAQLEYQSAAINSAVKEIDEHIIAEAKETDVLEWESKDNVMSITASGRRNIDAERVQMVLGDALFAKYGSSSITLANVEKLLRGKEITPEQKAQLKGLIYVKRGEPRVKVEPRRLIEEES